jgi:prepilin-type N-terminal cleavage/methylation domain-containing protein
MAVARQKGFTLLEMVVALAVLGVLVSFAAPAMSNYIKKRKIINATEAVYSQLQYARSEAIARSEDVYASFSANKSTTWAMGVSTTSGCDPTETDRTAANACTLVVDDGDGNVHGTDPDGDGTAITDTGDLVLKVTSSSDFDGIALGGSGSGSNVSFSGGTTQTRFNPVRGTATAGTVYLTLDDEYEMRVVVATIGRIRICSPSGSTNVPGYATCP